MAYGTEANTPPVGRKNAKEAEKIIKRYVVVSASREEPYTSYKSTI
jgi:hypothetical protein